MEQKIINEESLVSLTYQAKTGRKDINVYPSDIIGKPNGTMIMASNPIDTTECLYDEAKVIYHNSTGYSILLTRYAVVCGETGITKQTLIWFALRGGADNERIQGTIREGD